VLLEVTGRCDLACPVCFRDAGTGNDPTLPEVRAWIQDLAEPGRTLLQLSGGEPTLREDLPEIVRAARDAGCAHVQLNTNGLRLGREPGYAQALAEAGLSFVFLQFDGVREETHRTLRGRDLLEAKGRAIEACDAARLGVTLVPTLVPGVNSGELGGLLDYALARSPAVRGLHFQPVSSFGRYPWPGPEAPRLTLDELVSELEAQSGGRIRPEHLLPSRCDHPLCGFHGDFLVAPDRSLVPLSRKAAKSSCCDAALPERNRRFVARRWKRPAEPTPCCGTDLKDLDTFLDRVRTHGFTVTAMAFQDALTLDLARLRQCSLHVYDRGRRVPFCAHYLSPWPA
jgi:hypothetical protein